MIRTQILLTEEQARKLRKLGAAEGRSMADLVREGVGLLLDGRGHPARRERKARALACVGRYRSGLPDLGTAHDEHLEDAFGS